MTGLLNLMEQLPHQVKQLPVSFTCIAVFLIQCCWEKNWTTATGEISLSVQSGAISNQDAGKKGRGTKEVGGRKSRRTGERKMVKEMGEMSDENEEKGRGRTKSRRWEKRGMYW